MPNSWCQSNPFIFKYQLIEKKGQKICEKQLTPNEKYVRKEKNSLRLDVMKWQVPRFHLIIAFGFV